jgi:hypothetical protein
VLHTRLLLLLVPNAEVLVRLELLHVSSGELSQALIHPLINPPQSAAIIRLDGIDDVGSLIHDLLMENLVGVDLLLLHLAQLQLQHDNLIFERLALHRSGRRRNGNYLRRVGDLPIDRHVGVVVVITDIDPSQRILQLLVGYVGGFKEWWGFEFAGGGFEEWAGGQCVCEVWADRWAVCEVWADRWVEGEGKGGV